ncbi:C1 family peptidase [Nostoc sp. MS1]|uniref:C1 family peptidase n=1 Tax=Nostoc sp. MS1 TaxID=2764711 RepID=UPI001CC58BEE|nr:C1 family peptidase [Nostoc sp. MS1]BCL37796.1 hypothetical protein NSMS1_42430 [Nostoc sp. MS1]
MESNKNQQKKRLSTKKSLGWIPDYPDLRDYHLEEEGVKNQLTFKIEERTRGLEKMIEAMVSFIADTSSCTQEEKINEFKRRILGNIGFAKIRVHKLLINEHENTELDKKYPPKRIDYQSILSKQTTELKTYLAILKMQERMQESASNPENPSRINFCSVSEVVKWIRDEKYDEDTKSLVKDFQKSSGILDDGIVGLETYITLNEYFSKNQTLTQSEAPNNKVKGLSKIKFFSVTSLISRKQFVTILSIFQSKVIEQIENEYSKCTNNKKIFEYVFLKKIDVEPSLFKKIFEGKESLAGIKECISEKCICDKNSDIPQSEDIVTLLQNSSVTEPIFSVILKIISPLSQWNNLTWEEVIQQGFDKFEEIVNDSQQHRSSNNSNIEPGYSETELIENAISQTLSLIKLELSSIEDTKNNTVIFLYFLLKKYLNRFKKYISKAEAEINQEEKNNIFNKKEVFEIKLLSNDEFIPSNSDEKEPDKGEELFSSLDLHIPVVMSDVYLRELSRLQKEKNSSKKLYFLLPTVIDLSFWCSPVRDQGSLNSCTAFAAIALLEYFENRNFGQIIDASPLFLYKAALKKMKAQGDAGASIRETMKVLALFGVPPEESWPYEEDRFDQEPEPYCYAYAQNYKSLKYFLLDYAGITTESLLFQVKAVLAAGFPCIFGLTLYTSVYEQTNYEKGYIPYPDANKDKVVGGHTAVVVGYDDFKFIRCANRESYSRGAFLVRNSWGTEWGVNGYGWLPYDYVLAGLTSAWWSLLKAEWFDESNFGPARQGGEGQPDNPKGG